MTALSNEQLLDFIGERIFFEASGCWSWRGSRSRGYGLVRPRRVGYITVAHRVVYELVMGEIPEGLTLDHLCRNRSCVNPSHLEPVTMGENVLRGFSPSGCNSRKTHCVHGHEFTVENTYVYRDRPGRSCKTCRRVIQRRYRQRSAR